MNNVVGLSFKGFFIFFFFAEKSTYGSRKQCMRLTIFQQNVGTHGKRAFQTHTKSNMEFSVRSKHTPSLTWNHKEHACAT